MFIFLWPALVLAGSQQTSSTLASTIITNVRYYLTDSTESFWSDTELLVWLNDGIMDVIARSQCLETTEMLPLAIEIYEYPIGENYIGVKEVVFIDNDTSEEKALIPGSPDHFGRSEDADEPTHWYEWNGSVFAYPAIDTLESDDYVVWQDSPNVTYTDSDNVEWTNHTQGKLDLEAYLVKREEPITVSDTIPLPAAYDVPLLLYVYIQAMLKDGQWQKAAEALDKYKDMLERFEDDFTIQ